MDILYLKEFVDLAQTCNFQESAENMCISASSLSKHIQKMETELGVQLFDRSTRSVSLSKYGTILLSYASQMVILADDCMRDIQNSLSINQSQLNIGFLPMLSHFGILDLLSEFSKRYPNVDLNIIESYQPEELLLERKFDFVFADGLGPKDAQLTKLLLKTDHLVAVFPKNHPLAKNDYVTIDQLRNESFLLQVNSGSRPTITSQNFLSACQKCGFQAKVTFRSRYIATIAKMVADGKGVAILNSLEIQNEPNYEYAMVDIHPIVPFEIYLSYLPSRIQPGASADFLNYLKELTKANRPPEPDL